MLKETATVDAKVTTYRLCHSLMYAYIVDAVIDSSYLSPFICTMTREQLYNVYTTSTALQCSDRKLTEILLARC